MGMWDKLHTELNRAGRAAQGAIDEGRLRLEIFRVRQLADKSAQALGYAVYRARAKNEEPEPATWERLTSTLRDHEAEAHRLEQELAATRAAGAPSPSGDAEPPASPPADSAPTAP